MKTFIKVVLIILVMIISLFAVLFFVPVFKVENASVTGNNFLSDEDVLRDCGIEPGKTNMLHVNYFFASFAVKKKDPYISSVKISPSSFASVSIRITEDRPCGYIPYVNSYICINADGRVLDITNSPKGSLPLVSGVKFDHVSKGEFLKVPDPKVFRSLVEITRLMEKNDMDCSELTLNIADPNDLHIYIYGLDVILGNTENINQKISTFTEVLKKIDKKDKGFLYLNDPDNEIRFQYLT